MVNIFEKLDKKENYNTSEIKNNSFMIKEKFPITPNEWDNILENFVDASKIKMRKAQIYAWVYRFGVFSFTEMTNLPKDLRENLALKYEIEQLTLKEKLISKDGTIKYLFSCYDKNEVETVFIPEVSKSGAICLSSQVGCSLTCKFCHTGTQTLVRNLSANEIILQLLYIMKDLGEFPANKENKKITNIVFMGMGEPLYNYENVKDAIRLLSDNNGLSFSRRKIMVSTSGITPYINKLGHETKVRLAISLHSPFDFERNIIMPINKKYPISDILTACKSYEGLSKGNRIAIEYIMLRNINDSKKHAKKLISILENIPVKINLIPFNKWEGAEYERSEEDNIKLFASHLKKSGLNVTIRKTRGSDIYGACGQLKTISQRKSKSILNNLQSENHK